jgi:four helix bundle protein
MTEERGPKLGAVLFFILERQMYKFEKLEVWQLALDYVDLIYDIAKELPRNEEFNLKSQITRAATSVALNIAEGSTGQTDPEQARFLGMAIRSLIETVACLRILENRLSSSVIGLLISCILYCVGFSFPV